MTLVLDRYTLKLYDPLVNSSTYSFGRTHMALAIRRRPFTHRYDLLGHFFDRDWLGQPLAPGSTNDTTWVPPVDIEETEDAVIVRASIPGYSADEMSVSHIDGALLIEGARETSGETASDHDTRYHVRERRSGRFSRRIPLPVRTSIDNASADYKNGVLTARIPKARDAMPSSIQIGQS